MADARTLEDLSDLFRRTADEHHKVFVDVDGEDEEWPMWYANFMTDDLNELVDAEWTRSEVIHLLIAADREFVIAATGGNWPDFYAQYFLDEG